MKKCKMCFIEFEPKSLTRGHEQVYCSVKCRNNFYKNKLTNKIIENAKQESKADTIQLQPNTEYNESFYGRQGRESLRADDRPGFYTNSHLATIKELYEAKNESNFYKLKNEMMQDELSQLKIEYSNLEMELDEDEGEEKSNYSNILGGVIEEFKKDPLNTINFATELIGNLLKPRQLKT